jgi:N-acetyl-gamma-glutamyl-phosphate reductase
MHRTQRVAVVGASGYAGEELITRLVQHPGVELSSLTSRQYAGRGLADVFPRLRGFSAPQSPPPAFTLPDAAEIVAAGANVAFLALPHGLASEFAVPLLRAGLRIIDLSADFRLRDARVYEEFYGHAHPAPGWLSEAVYGLPELPGRREQIASARLVAAPGCYPTSILVPLVPLLRAGLIDPGQILVSSMSGVSGAGRKADVDLLFAECNENARAYGAPKHRHLSEIEQELSLAAAEHVRISFCPHLVPVTRGILTTIYVRPQAGVSSGALAACWQGAYGNEPFVRLLPSPAFPELRHVARTNFIDLAWRDDARTGRWLLFSAEDNIVKGAAGQAVQCFNLMTGWPEEIGL